MGLTPLSRLCVIVIGVAFTGLALIRLPYNKHVRAQQQCFNVRPANAPFWRPGATVTVVVDSNSKFNGTEITALTRAIQNWNGSKGITGNNSNVTINTQFTYSLNPPDVATTAPIMYIKRGDTGTDAAHTRTESNGHTHPYTSIARVTINQNTNWLAPYDPAGWCRTQRLPRPGRVRQAGERRRRRRHH